MSSYVLIELDTTSPIIEIFSPRYTTKDIYNTIVIESNEALADYQDIYVIDSEGRRHDYTFEKESDNTYIGIIRFSNYPIGISTIYARLKDEVDNFSNIVSKPIEIKESLTLLNIDIRDLSRDLEISDKDMSSDISNRSMDIEIRDFDNEVM